MNIVFLFFVFGLAVGSFLNVVVYRLRDTETLLGRSFCRQCHHLIRWYDNIPLLSFILLRGKCRDCQAPISWQYPLLEFLTALFFALIGHYFFEISDVATWAETLWLLVLVSLLLVIAAYDLLHMEIPLLPLIVAAVGTALYLIYQARGIDVSFMGEQVQALLGMLVVGGLFFALVYASKETWMGWGDVWLGGLAGAVVGLSGALVMMTLSFGIGAIVGLSLIFFGQKGMKSQIPFAPYLVLGTLLTLFLPEMFPSSSIIRLLL